VTWSDEAPAALVARLSAAGAQRLYVDGGVTIQRFLAAGLIDDLTMTLFPVLLGEGRRLFGPLAGDVPLQLVGSRVFDFGFVQLNYRVLRDA
jgi:dihydrofolate reductase